MSNTDRIRRRLIDELRALDEFKDPLLPLYDLLATESVEEGTFREANDEPVGSSA